MVNSRQKNLPLVLLLPVLSIFWCRFTAKRYDNTYVKITEEKVVFHTAGRINEIELPNLEKVILDGKTKGITALDLIMRFNLYLWTSLSTIVNFK